MHLTTLTKNGSTSKGAATLTSDFGDPLNEAQKEACAVLVMRMMLEDLTVETGRAFDDLLAAFASSKPTCCYSTSRRASGRKAPIIYGAFGSKRASDATSGDVPSTDYMNVGMMMFTAKMVTSDSMFATMPPSAPTIPRTARRRTPQNVLATSMDTLPSLHRSKSCSMEHRKARESRYKAMP